MEATNGLYGWQNGVRIMIEESDLGNNIMLIAPTCEGKSHLLHHLNDRNDEAVLVQAGYNLTADDLEEHYKSNDVVLIDEAGMMTDYQGIPQPLEEYSDTQTVMATVPNNPPMAMVRPRFDVVVEVSVRGE